MPTLILKKNVFSGAANLHNGFLENVVRQIAGTQTKNAVAAIADLTDNGGGAAANGTVDAIPLLAATPLTGDNCPSKAEIETDLGLVKDALTEIGAKIVAITAVAPAFTRTNSIGGAGADGTIAAITTAITGTVTADARVAKAGFNTQVGLVQNYISQLVRDVNTLARACNITELVDNVAGTIPYATETVYAAFTVATGTAAPNGLTSVTSAQATTTLAAMAAAIKELSAKLNTMTSDTAAVPSVIAG